MRRPVPFHPNSGHHTVNRKARPTTGQVAGFYSYRKASIGFIRDAFLAG